MTTTEEYPLIVACKEGDAATVADLLSTDPECYSRPVAWTDKNQQQLETPPIFIAVDYNQVDVVRVFAESSTGDLNILDSNEYTPLQWASWNGNEEMVKLLIDHGARVDQGALDLAKEYKHKELVALLLQHINLYEGLNGDVDEIMIKASREGDVRKVQELIAAGYNFEKWKDEDGTYQEYSPIYVAMKNGHIEVIREFLQAGVEAELHSTHFHYPEEEEEKEKIKPAELTEEQIQAIIQAHKEEEEAEAAAAAAANQDGDEVKEEGS
jgi:ankyrin repeat protein